MTSTEQHVDASADFESLKNILIQEKQREMSPDAVQEAKEEEVEEEKKPQQSKAKQEKKARFQKGEQSWEVDEDAEIEFMADKGLRRLKVSELKDRAAGDIAVKRRMHELHEEKKKVNSTLSDFAKFAKEDPLAALEYIASRAREVDQDFDFNTYLSALGEQAEALDGMTPAERENYRLKRQLKEVEGEKQEKDRLLNASSLAKEIMDDFELSGDELNEYVEQVVNSPELMEGAESEEDIFERVEMLAEETRNQRLAYEALQSVIPDAPHDDPIVFAMADVLRNNPELTDDFDTEDMKEIVEGLLQQEKKVRAQKRASHKMRQTQSVDEISGRGMSDFEILAQKLNDEKEELKKQQNVRW